MLLVFCTSSCEAGSQQRDKSIMTEEQTITLAPGDSRQITLQSRGAAGLQLMYEIADTNVVVVERKPPDPSELERARTTNIGGAVAAVFEIKALSQGQSEIVFFETRPWEPDFQRIVQRKVTVTVAP